MFRVRFLQILPPQDSVTGKIREIIMLNHKNFLIILLDYFTDNIIFIY